MATRTLLKHCLQTTRKLGYVSEIQKIPEVYRVDHLEHYMLPCSNDYSMLVLCDNPFDIVSVIYGIKKLHKSVITHLKTYRKYYTLVSTAYLNKKKLDFVNWLCFRQLPVTCIVNILFILYNDMYGICKKTVTN